MQREILLHKTILVKKLCNSMTKNMFYAKEIITENMYVLFVIPFCFGE